VTATEAAAVTAAEAATVTAAASSTAMATKGHRIGRNRGGSKRNGRDERDSDSAEFDQHDMSPSGMIGCARTSASVTLKVGQGSAKS